MYFKFKCPHCDKSLRVREELAGRKCACPYCKESVRIPEQVMPETPEPVAKGGGFPGIDLNAAPTPKPARPGKPAASAAVAATSTVKPKAVAAHRPSKTHHHKGWTDSSQYACKTFRA